MTTFMSLQTPLHATARFYDSSKRHDAQVSDIPETFLDAMSVREEVYVDEQQILLANEFDAEDHKSYHWVSYASIASSASPPLNSTSELPATTHSNGANGDHSSRKGSASKLAVGTIRLVPPPHDHEESQPSHNEGPDMSGSDLPLDKAEPLGCLRRAHEPYVKLGRLAVLKPYRKLGLSTLLVKAALQYASEHPDNILPPLSPTAAEQKRLELEKEGKDPEVVTRWEGLVLVHAQKGIEKLWKQWGFVRDTTMGEWDEEGILHVGMWKRISVQRRRKSLTGTGTAIP
ncbi:hypothetical protein CAC42_7571 [Sphaceloma murrayae]|uniref:N-acetyltransferase domain-containing protein n=1 Tax=Sphaceloma murrayae TaxID=2082308 RepID=A0A2K1QT14_9PEZI|nr:hypothetical protein CAC42_7571 [Sphaceloma murrayae]